MGHPAMPPVTAFMVIAPCVLVISLPALLCHALLRNYWLASIAIWVLAFASGFAVAHVWGFPFDHLAFGFFASLIGLATGMLVGIPFVLHRRGLLADFWMRLMNRDLPQDEPDIRSKVTRLKELHRRRRQRFTTMLAIWFLAGVVAGLATWIAQEPAHRDLAMLSGVLALGLGILFGGSLLTRLLFPKPNINCPQCGRHWSGKISKNDWVTWTHCPGCGLEMDEGPAGEP
jgi:hypothetical protein